MKGFFILLFAFVVTQSFGQTTKNNTPAILEDQPTARNQDTSLRIVHVNKDNHGQQPAYFINGKYVSDYNFIRPDQIESVNVVKRDTLIDHSSYSGQIYIKTRNTYTPKLISLSEIKNKYTDFNEELVVFILDGDLVNADYEHYFVDEANLLTIIIDQLEIGKDKTGIGVIKLLTKTEKNIKDRNKIILRGAETAVNK